MDLGITNHEYKKSREIIENLVIKLDTINVDNYDKQKTFDEFVKPFFEALEWDFQTDVRTPKSISENKADYTFKIDKEIDEEVYKLYEITEKEKSTIESLL